MPGVLDRCVSDITAEGSHESPSTTHATQCDDCMFQEMQKRLPNSTCQQSAAGSRNVRDQAHFSHYRLNNATQ